MQALMRLCGIVILMVIIAAPSTITGARTEQLRLGVMPFTSAAALVNQFRHLRDHLQNELSIDVMLESAPDFRTFAQRLGENRYDVAFAAPHLAAFATSQGNYRPLVQTAPKSATAYVRADSEIKDLSDLSGRTVVTPDGLAIVTLLAEAAWFGKAGVRPPAEIRHTPSHNNALLLVANGRADVAISIPDVYARLPEADAERLRAIGTVGDMFAELYLLSGAVDADLADRIEKGLLAFPNTDAGRQFRTGPLSRAIPSDLKDYDQYMPVVRDRLDHGE